MRVLLSILLGLSASLANAQQETTELYLDVSTCLLQERAFLIKDDPIMVQGVKNEFGCLAFITDDVFNARYNFCVYSGFEISNARDPSWYGCSISREKDSFMFAARFDKNEVGPGSIECKFMCFLK